MPSGKKVAAYTISAVVIVLLIIVPLTIAYMSVHPGRCGLDATPASKGLRFHSTSIKAGNIELSTWIIEPMKQEKSEIVVLMHGYTSCKSAPEILDVAAEFSRRGFRVIAFDFRAHGESGGSITSIGPLEADVDTKAVVDWVSSHYPKRPLVLAGFSMGAVAAIMEGYKDPRVKAIIADSPYPILSEVVPRWLGSKAGIPGWYSQLISAWGSLLTGENLDFGPMKLRNIPKPLVIFVGDRDPLVKPKEAEEISSKSPCGVLIVVPGAGHVGSYKILGVKGYVDQISSVLFKRCPIGSSSLTSMPWPAS